MLLLKPFPWEDVNNILHLRSPRHLHLRFPYSGEPLSSLGLQSNGYGLGGGDLKTVTLKGCILSG